jgi:hypothetical protein
LCSVMSRSPLISTSTTSLFVVGFSFPSPITPGSLTCSLSWLIPGNLVVGLSSSSQGCIPMDFPHGSLGRSSLLTSSFLLLI